MSFTRLALRFAAPVPRLEQFQRYLFVGPHPDDIEIGAGATAARLAALGRDVCFLICTDGRYGGDSASASELADLRRRESLRAAAMLGVTDVRFLGLSDGGFYPQDELVRSIARVIGDFRPDVLLAPDPCPASEGHIDHLNTGNAVRRLAVSAGNPGIMAQYGAAHAPVQAVAFYMTARPNRYVGARGFFRKQLDAVCKGHASQFPENSPEAKNLALYLNLRSIDFGLRSFKGRAEGFRVLGQLHMHCLPEAD